MKLRYYICIGILLLATGFGLGRWAMPSPKSEIKYITLPAISSSLKVPDLKPISSNLTGSIKFVTVYIDSPSSSKPEEPGASIQEPGPIDTLESYKKTVEDWNYERKYAGIFFDTPELGKLTWSTTVQYNTQTGIDWNYEPIQKTDIVVKPKRVIEPFVRASYNTFDQYTLGGGLYYKNVGLEVFYIRDVRLDKKGVGGALSFKF